MAGIVLNNILLQLFYFVAVVFLFGYLISLINKLFYRLANNDKRICYVTGLIGTPIHELCHALMCVLFSHKISEIKLFHIDRESGTLGYVSHSYDKKNLYQVVGNYFVGTAPIVGGTLVLFLLVKFMLPETFVQISGDISAFAASQSGGISIDAFKGAFVTAFEIVKSIFDGAGAGFSWWCFMIVALCIALHMNLSPLDIKGSLKAIPFLVIFVSLLNFVLAYVFDTAYEYYVSFMNGAGSYLTSILILSVVLSLVCLFVALIIRIIVNILR